MLGQNARHDFGTILSDGQPLGVVFHIGNPTGRQLRLTEGMALRSCCSVLGELPGIVEPGASVPVAAWLRTRDRKGPLSADFLIRTDDPGRSEIRLTLRAHLVRAVEWEEPTSGEEPAFRGRPWSKRIQLLHRQQAGQQSTRPELVAPPGVEIAIEHSAERRDGLAGTTETVHSWLLNWPLVETSGHQVAEVVARWPDGEEFRHVLNWDVVPVIQTTPRALVVRADETDEATVVVRSFDGAFQITQVTGACVGGYRIVSGAGTDRQEVQIKLMLSEVEHTAETIQFATDHACEPLVPVSVVVLR